MLCVVLLLVLLAHSADSKLLDFDHKHALFYTNVLYGWLISSDRPVYTVQNIERFSPYVVL